MSEDPEDEQPVQMPEMGKRYTFQGKDLFPYGSARDDLMTRLSFDRMTRKEAAGMLLFICLQPAERCVFVRSEEQIAKFLVEKNEWLDGLGWVEKPEVVVEALKIYGEITGDVDAVAKVGPELKGGDNEGPKGKGRKSKRPATK